LLLTGSGGPSGDLPLDAIDSREDERSFFPVWMVAWARRLVIAKVLAALRDELAVSRRRTASRRVRCVKAGPRSWVVDSNARKAEIEKALMPIDVFPDAPLCCQCLKRCSDTTWGSSSSTPTPF
jgi:hypothetical protein